MAEQSSSRLMEVTFPGGLAVNATFRGRTIQTDQPVRAGGTDTAPPPFDLFLASIATCAGYYVLTFFRKRNIDTEGVRVTLEPIRNQETGHFHRMKVDIQLPPEFPEKYVPVVVRAVNQCTVKRHIVEPPEFEVNAVLAPPVELST